MATRRWIGNAADVAHVSTVTFAGAWADTNTITTTINGKSHVITVGSAVTDSATAAAAYCKAFNGTAPSANEFTVNFDAAAHGEFAEMTATVSGSVVTLTGDTAGKPMTITSVVNTAAGTSVLAAVTTATGKNHFDNVDNWDAGSVPVDLDDIIFDRGSVSCLYGLAQSAVTPTSIEIRSEYTGYIGLPKVNADDATRPYNEYRTTHLALSNAGDATNVAIRIGEGDGSGSSRIHLDLGDSACGYNVWTTGSRIDLGIPPLLVKGTGQTGLSNWGGDIGVGFYGEAGAVKSFEHQAGNTYFGKGQVFSTPTYEVSGGTIESNTAIAAGTINFVGGTWYHNAGAIGTLNIGGGNTTATFYDRASEAITTANCYRNGVLDNSQNDSGAVTTLTAYYGSSVIDPLHNLTVTTFALPDGIESVTLRMGRGITDLTLAF